MENRATSYLTDWPYYTFWWGIWIVVPGFLMAMGQGRQGDGGMLTAVGLFTVYAVVASTFFTLLQNGVNRQRRKPVSWAFALLIWISLAACSAYFFSR
jgi:uncharacterized membrane protein